MFRILSTLMVPVAGQAIILGHDAAKDPSQLRREIGVVFQAQSIDLKLTAAENLQHQGHLYGLHGPALRARIKEILERVRLADRARDRAETFSGGMQRLASNWPRACCTDREFFSWTSPPRASTREHGATSGNI